MSRIHTLQRHIRLGHISSPRVSQSTTTLARFYSSGNHPIKPSDTPISKDISASPQDINQQATPEVPIPPQAPRASKPASSKLPFWPIVGIILIGTVSFRQLVKAREGTSDDSHRASTRKFQ